VCHVNYMLSEKILFADVTEIRILICGKSSKFVAKLFVLIDGFSYKFCHANKENITFSYWKRSRLTDRQCQCSR